jgi:hypothetical protein
MHAVVQQMAARDGQILASLEARDPFPTLWR